MDESPLLEVFGNRTVLAIADVLMTHPSVDYSKKDLADITDVSEATIHRHWEAVERSGIARESREYGNTTLYALNQDSAVAKALFQLDHALWEKLEEEQAATVQSQ